MLNSIIGKKTVYIVTGYTDMRKGIDGLAAIVQGKLFLDPYSKALFMFCGRNPQKLKGLIWEGDGFMLLYKRLEIGKITVVTHERKKHSTHKDSFENLETEEVIHEAEDKGTRQMPHVHNKKTPDETKSSGVKR